MDQTEIRRRLEAKVAEMVAPPVAGSLTRMCYTTSFLASNVLRQHMARRGANQTNCDLGSKVGNISFHTFFADWSRGVQPDLLTAC